MQEGAHSKGWNPFRRKIQNKTDKLLSYHFLFRNVLATTCFYRAIEMFANDFHKCLSHFTISECFPNVQNSIEILRKFGKSIVFLSLFTVYCLLSCRLQSSLRWKHNSYYAYSRSDEHGLMANVENKTAHSTTRMAKTGAHFRWANDLFLQLSATNFHRCRRFGKWQTKWKFTRRNCFQCIKFWREHKIGWLRTESLSSHTVHCAHCLYYYCQSERKKKTLLH